MRYIVLFFLVANSVFAQEINMLDESGKKHGLWKGFYEESKRPRYEGNFNHGKEVGLFKFFDDTKAGTVIATREFNTNDNSCYTIFYNQKNNKVSEGKVVNKQFEGEWKYYHENSNQVMTIENFTNGKLNGLRKVFYKSGKIAEETNYKNGLKNGIYKKIAENGVVLEESNFLNNEYDGLAIFKSPDDKIVSQGKFKNGLKVGIWQIFEDGKMREENMSYSKKKFKKKNEKIN